MQDESSLCLAELVSSALSQSKLSGLSTMLSSIARAVNAYGCILWQVAPGADLEAAPPTGYLFVLAEWFEDGQSMALHDLPLESSVTGKAILGDEPINIDDIWNDERVSKNDPFLKRAEIRAMCSVPIVFRDNARGAVNVYRSERYSAPFSKKEVGEVEHLASLVSALYKTIRDEVSLELMGGINELLHEAELRAYESPLPKEEIKKIIQHICKLVSESFQCVETSVFLSDKLDSPRTYELMGTTWPGDFKKSVYEREDDGLTGWVLERGEPVSVFDLAHFERDRDVIRREYPGLSWTDSLDIRTTAREFLNLKPEENLPPLSFMAAPIAVGERVYGVIRCSVAREGPYYFADRELNLLKLVAAQITRYWSNWLSRYELERSRLELEKENRSWRELVQNVGKLNNFVRKELTREAPNEHRIFSEALNVTNAVIEGAEIMDVRLLDERSGELYFAETFGEAWSEGSKKEINQRKQQRFPVGDPAQPSAGAHVHETRQLYLVKDTSSDPFYREVFPRTRRLIVAPIRVEDEFFGVLDIRGTGESDFPEHAQMMAKLLGQQLGMYSYLAATIRELRKTKADLSDHVELLQEMQKKQIQTFQDLAHQFKTPIIQAHLHVQSLLYDIADQKLKQRLWAIRGLCGKAKRVSYNTELFSAIARKEPIQLKITMPLKCEDLIRMLIEAAQDNKLINSRRNINFDVDKGSFERSDVKNPRMRELVAHKGLLEQAVTNILDNAGKYSFSNTTVYISGGLTGSGGFHISIENKGIQIHRDDVKHCVERGWQSEKAKSSSGGGSGIGLWIVDHIMKAHEGELKIEPTNAEKVTKVKLVFPSARVL